MYYGLADHMIFHQKLLDMSILNVAGCGLGFLPANVAVYGFGFWLE